MNLRSWLKGNVATHGNADAKICSTKNVNKNENTNTTKTTQQKSKHKNNNNNRKRQYKKKLQQLHQKRKICDYMNLHEDYRKKLSARIETSENGEQFGDLHTKKMKNIVRIWFTNPCGIGVDPN